MWGVLQNLNLCMMQQPVKGLVTFQSGKHIEIPVTYVLDFSTRVRY